jgi:hypothetical protein
VFDKLMPMRTELGSSVTFRSRRDYYEDIFEQYFQIRFVGNMVAPPTATVISPVGRSLHRQLLELHMQARRAPATDLLTKIRYERRDLTDASCPDIRKRVVDLDSLKWSVPSRDLIPVHPINYEILLNYVGGFADLSFIEQQHALVHWALDTHAQLAACARENRTR